MPRLVLVGFQQQTKSLSHRSSFEWDNGMVVVGDAQFEIFERRLLWLL